MMLCLALRSSPELVYRRALQYVTVKEINEGFAGGGRWGPVRHGVMRWTASSWWPRRRFCTNACPATTILALRSCCLPASVAALP
jgi:hypothetical protein